MDEKKDRTFTVAIVAITAISLFGLLAFFAYLYKNGSAAPFVATAAPSTPVQQVQLREAPFIPAQDLPVSYNTPVPMLTYDRGVRITVNSSGRKFLTWRSPFTGWLTGVTVFVSSIDPGDTYGILLNGRSIKDSAYPVSGTAQGKEYSESIQAGDTMTLYYDSRGNTVKNIDLTPAVRYSPSQNPGV